MRNFLFGIIVGAIVGIYGYTVYTAPEPVYDNVIVTVSEGETLWEIAERYRDPEEDVRLVVDRIRNANKLDQCWIHSGQGLIVPVLKTTEEE